MQTAIAPTPGRGSGPFGNALLHALPALLVFVAFWPVTGNKFVSLDDPSYIVGNAHVTTGLTWEGIRWAFTSFQYANWHPLTWLVHMADVQVFGLRPGGHHLTSLLLHALNTVVLQLFLYRLTGHLWRSLAVAAFFGIHPLHVESVAWAAEKKDLLSTFFWLLALSAYTGYVRRRKWGLYAVAILCFAASLMSKPMAVTMPLVLLLLDFWPLRRRATGNCGDRRRGPSLAWLVGEKLPFIAISLAGAALVWVAQNSGGAVVGLEELSLAGRFALIPVAYAAYLVKTFWPLHLSLFYPYPTPFPPPWQTTACILALAGVSAVSFFQRERRPYLVVGWLLYLTTLLPVIGIIKVGDQFIADRYTYFPLVWIFVALVWGVADLGAGLRHARAACALLGVAVLSSFVALTCAQARTWRTSISAFEQAVRVRQDSWLLKGYLGVLYGQNGRHEEAARLLGEVRVLRPGDAEILFYLGTSLNELGRHEEGIETLEEAVRLAPRVAAYNNLGLGYSRTGRHREAAAALKKALEIAPDSVVSLANLADELDLLGETAEALRLLTEACAMDLERKELLLLRLGRLYEKQGDREASRRAFAAAKRLESETSENERPRGGEKPGAAR